MKKGWKKMQQKQNYPHQLIMNNYYYSYFLNKLIETKQIEEFKALWLKKNSWNRTQTHTSLAVFEHV